MKRPIGVSKQLVVEGYDDLFSVVGLMRAHVDWPQRPEECPVYMEIGKSAPEILEDGYLTTILKSREIQTLGVMLDADTKPSGRYERIRNLCSGFFPTLPEELPRDGLVSENDEHKWLGVWIMPDNSSEGCLETFLKYMVPNQSQSVWEHAIESVTAARAKGAPCRDGHTEKANLYTWLAWQDPPVQSPGIALTKKILDPHSPSAGPFVKWFRELYKL